MSTGSYSQLLHVFRKFLMRENDVTPSNVMEMKIDVTKKSKWRPNGAKQHHASPPSDLSRNISLDFTIGYKGDQC